MASEQIEAVAWHGDWASGTLDLLDQTRLPDALEILHIDGIDPLVDAIMRMALRGAAAIGISAAYGIVLHVGRYAAAHPASLRADDIDPIINQACARLRECQPTVANLHWAIARMRDCHDSHAHLLSARELSARLLMEAKRIHREDAELCARISENGATLLAQHGGVYT
ncbi:MAG: S-methyl-5-thioribose-1-phosphate isomerase, partial [Planctomycetota bacterium]